jgi:hypothetical protein
MKGSRVERGRGRLGRAKRLPVPHERGPGPFPSSRSGVKGEVGQLCPDGVAIEGEATLRGREPRQRDGM